MARWSGSVKLTDDVNEWLKNLEARQADRVHALIRELQDKGPMMGPEGSKRVVGQYPIKLRELRVKTPAIRILYTFDPEANALLLVAGDKTGEWTDWYPHAIKRALRNYQGHLTSLNRNPGASR